MNIQQQGLHRRAKQAWRESVDAFLKACLPSTCQLCSARADGLICPRCAKDTQHPERPSCSICAIPITGAGAGAGDNEEQILCPECLKQTPSYTKALCGSSYQPPTDHMVRQFKDHYGFCWLATLCPPLISKVQAHYGAAGHPWPQFLVPMPLHWRKTLKRGYNQSDIIAAELSQALSIPIYRGLKKVYATTTQQKLSRHLRMQNLMGSLQCVGDLHGKHLALIDDVMTTGSTAECATQVLLDAGAARVDIWALTRTPKPNVT